MARALKDPIVLPAHPHVHPQSKWAIPAFAFPAAAGTHLPTREGWEAELTMYTHNIQDFTATCCNIHLIVYSFFTSCAAALKTNVDVIIIVFDITVAQLPCLEWRICHSMRQRMPDCSDVYSAAGASWCHRLLPCSHPAACKINLKN